jgi:hypothetical protein
MTMYQGRAVPDHQPPVEALVQISFGRQGFIVGHIHSAAESVLPWLLLP